MKKIEFSKIVLAAVLLSYFVGLGIGIWAVIKEVSLLGILLGYIGSPVVTAIGFYSWKSKAENVIKLKTAYPKETEGIPVDLNHINV